MRKVIIPEGEKTLSEKFWPAMFRKPAKVPERRSFLSRVFRFLVGVFGLSTKTNGGDK